MKTTVKIFAALIIAATTVTFTACKKDTPELPLTETSLENTAWKPVMFEIYKPEGDSWVFSSKLKLPDINPSILYQYKDQSQWAVNKKWSYMLDPIKRTITNDAWVSTIIRLSADELVFDDDGFKSRRRYFFDKIPPLSLAQLKGVWEITACQKYNNDNNIWEVGGMQKGYRIEFGDDGKGKNSRDQTCNYTINGNIVFIECIYGNAFVVECTGSKLVFVHQNKDPKGVYTKETFKRIK